MTRSVKCFVSRLFLCLCAAVFNAYGSVSIHTRRDLFKDRLKPLPWPVQILNCAQSMHDWLHCNRNQFQLVSIRRCRASLRKRSDQMCTYMCFYTDATAEKLYVIKFDDILCRCEWFPCFLPKQGRCSSNLA